MRYIRIKTRRASDCVIGMRRQFDIFYEPLLTIKASKKFAKETYYKHPWVPHYANRLYHSMPNIRLNLKQADEVDNHQKVFKHGQNKIG